MYQPTDLKKGTVCQIDGKPYRVIEYGQKVMGRGGSIVNVRLKNLIDGSVIPKTFKGADKIETAEVRNLEVQYLYNDGEIFFFMDPTTFEQFELPADLVDEAKTSSKKATCSTFNSLAKRSSMLSCRKTSISKSPTPNRSSKATQLQVFSKMPHSKQAM